MADAKIHANTSKVYYNFIYKAVIVAVFLVTLPFFSSLAPEFVNQNLNTTSLEILQLIFVGIAVSYGLFSKRSEESNIDNAESYMCKMLQVSSSFYDESESSPVFDDNEVQTWNSKYHRGESVTVVAKENHSHSQFSDKPLYLPVRSLKSRVCEPETREFINEFDSKDSFLSKSSSSSSSMRFRGMRDMNVEEETEENIMNRTKSLSRNGNKSINKIPLNLEENIVDREGSKGLLSNGNESRNERFRNKRPQNGKFEGVNPINLEKQAEENGVHHSPVPWRSRSGRMEMKEYEDGPSMENPLKSRSFGSSSSVLSHSQAKNVENISRRTNPGVEKKGGDKKLGNSRASGDDKIETWSKEMVETFFENRIDSRKIIQDKSSSTFMDMHQVEKEDCIEKVSVETDEETEMESEDDYFEEIQGKEEPKKVGEIQGKVESVSDCGPDVDKKADEFIAKFKEQIRLQRTESIGRSTDRKHSW